MEGWVVEGAAASANRVSCAHDPLKPHPVRQDVHSAQEMTLIDCSRLTESKGGKWCVKIRQFAQWVCGECARLVLYIAHEKRVHV